MTVSSKLKLDLSYLWVRRFITTTLLQSELAQGVFKNKKFKNFGCLSMKVVLSQIFYIIKLISKHTKH